jgi:hypothetical protein
MLAFEKLQALSSQRRNIDSVSNKPTKIVHQQCIPSTCLYFIRASLNQLSVVFLNRRTLRPCSILDI